MRQKQNVEKMEKTEKNGTRAWILLCLSQCSTVYINRQGLCGISPSLSETAASLGDNAKTWLHAPTQPFEKETY